MGGLYLRAAALRPRGLHAVRIACILTVFPSMSETFIFSDLRALQEAGHELGLLHFLNRPASVWQPDALRLRDRVIRGGPLLSWSVLRDLLALLARRPLATLGTLGWIALRGGGTLRGRAKTLLILPKCVQFAADCQRWKADQVHATWANHAAVAAMVTQRLTGIPYSMSAHAGQDVFRDPVMLKEKVEGAEFVTVCNRHAYERLREVAAPECRDKIHHLSHGVDVERFRPRAGQQRRQPPRLLFLGRLRYGKGIPYLIEAADLLRAAGRDFQLDLVGEGSDEGEIRASIEQKGLGDRISLCGPAGHAQVPEHLARADVLILPSEIRSDGGREGLSNAVLEAMAAGVPVVATRISSIEEAIQDGVSGLLVPQKDPAALASAVGRLLDDPELAATITRNARLVVEEERFERRACGARFAAMFRAGASPAPGPR